MAQASSVIGVAGAGVRIAVHPGIRLGGRSRRTWWEWLNSVSIVGLCLLFLAGALFYVWQHVYVVRQGYELERLRGTHAKLVQENKMLRLEAGQLRSLRRVEEISRIRLGMLTPKPGQVVLLPESTIQ
jgi:cell division protein FtsL